MNIYFYCDESRFNKRKMLFIILTAIPRAYTHTYIYTYIYIHQKKTQYVLQTHKGAHTFFVNGKELSREKSKIEI